MNHDPIQAARELLMQEVNLDPTFKRAAIGVRGSDRWQEEMDQGKQDAIDQQRYERNHPGEEE